MAAPPVPTGLAAVAGNHNVALTWDDSAGAVSYDVYRDDVLLTTVPAATFKALTATSAGAGGDSATLAVTTAGTTYPAISSLFDNFDAATLTKWTASGAPAISGGVLYVPTTTGYPSVTSVGTFDLTGSAIAVQVPQAATNVPAADAYTAVQLFDPLTGFSYTIQVASATGDLTFMLQAGTQTSVNVVYDPAVHCWWRIRHSTTSGNVTMETSANGTTYTTRRTITPPFAAAITGLRVYLASGYNAGAVQPTAAQFDNVNSMATAIQAPANLAVSTAIAMQLTATWDASVGATSYEVSRDGTVIQTVTATTYTDVYAAAQAGETHSYSVRAVSANARSAPTAVRSAVVPGGVSAMGALTQTFDGQFPDWTPSSATNVFASSGLVGINSTTAFPTLESSGTYDLTGSAAAVQVAQVGQLSSAYTGMALVSQLADNSFAMQAVNGTGLQMSVRTAGVADNPTPIAYDPHAAAYFRILHSGVNILFQTSPDASTWTTRRLVATPWDITRMKAQLYAGYVSGTAPQAALFDNFNTMATATAEPTGFQTAWSNLGGNALASLNWVAVSGASGYLVFADGVQIANVTPGTATSYSTAHPVGVTRLYAICAYRTGLSRSARTATQSLAGA